MSVQVSREDNYVMTVVPSFGTNVIYFTLNLEVSFLLCLAFSVCFLHCQPVNNGPEGK